VPVFDLVRYSIDKYENKNLYGGGGQACCYQQHNDERFSRENPESFWF
jgi:hypothetical protein